MRNRMQRHPRRTKPRKFSAWYKAAYYDTVSMSYFDFPAGSDALTTRHHPGATANTVPTAAARS